MTRLIFLVLLAVLIGSSASAQPDQRVTSPNPDLQAHSAATLDTARFRTAPFPLQTKVFRQEFNHTELSANPFVAKSLIVGGNVQDEMCANRTIRSAMLYARLKMGPIDYEFGYTDFTVTAVVKMTAFDGSGYTLLPSPYLCTLKVEGSATDAKPEQLFRQEFTGIYSQVDHITVDVVSYIFQSTAPGSIPQSLQNNVQLEASFTEEFSAPAINQSAPAANLPLIEILPLPSTDGVLDKNPVKFKWQLVQDCGNDKFSDYQVQVLRLYNRDASKPGNDETRIREKIDWSRALTVETGSDKTDITLTLAEGTGYYVWRVRPIGNKYPGGIANDRNWGVWTVAPGNITLDIDGVNDPSLATYGGAVFFYDQFDRNKNWTYGRSFNEGDDSTHIEEAMTYSDGLLQPRQSQDHIATESKLVVGQTIFDYSNRAALSTLLAPIEWNGFGFQSSVVPSTSGGAYTAAQFDKGSGTSVNWNDPEPIGSSGPLYSYYSDQNPDLSVPNAGRYPFGRTVFFPDGTGRMRESGNPGSTLRIGGGAEGLDRTTKAYYGRATDAELIRLFGDEAPASNTVQRLTLIDADKVTSIHYVDNDEHTIATCLARTPIVDGTHLRDLTEPIVQDVVAENITNNVRSADNELTSKTTITLVTTSDVTVDYEIWPEEVHNLCTSTCRVCEYKVDLLAIPMSDPEDMVRPDDPTIWHETVTVPPGVCNPESPTTHHWTTTATFKNLPPGSYTIVKRLYVDPLNNDGDHESEAFANQVENAVLAETNGNAVVGQARAFLANADINGLYSYLDNQGSNGVTKNGSIYSIDAGCCSVTIEEKRCEPKSACATGLDFEKLLYDTWGSAFGMDLRKYFFDNDGNPMYPALSGQDKGQFNLMIGHMVNDADPAYNCDTLWTIWSELVRNFGRAATINGDGDPTHLKLGYNLLEDFLSRAKKQYDGVSPNAYGVETFTISGQTVHRYGYFEYAYRSFRYGGDVADNESCRRTYIGVDGSGSVRRIAGDGPTYVPNLETWNILGHDSHWANALDKKWEAYYNCFINRFTVAGIQLPPGCDPPESEDCVLALKAKVESTCQNECAAHEEGFRQSIRDAYHAMNKTVEPDAYRPDNGDPIPTGGPYDISKAQVECLVGLLIQNCADSCHITIVHDPNPPNAITAFGTAEEVRKITRAMTFSWEVGIPQNDACPQGNEWVHVTDAEADPAYARLIKRKMNLALEAYKLEGRNHTALENAQALWEKYRDLTGDNSGACTWYTRTTSHGSADSGCCPPHGLPDIFTMGEHIESRFEIDPPCSLVYVRTCTQNGFPVTNREVLCNDICSLHSCDGESVCFRWREPSSPGPNITNETTCAKRLAHELSVKLDNQIAQCAAFQRTLVEEDYRHTCTLPDVVRDVMTVRFSLERYHFTLNYYDRAGRLVRTVPPAGVIPLAAGATRAMHPNHTLITTYEYNSLDQLVRRHSPDGNQERYWYDGLGRIRFSQDFDQLGRNAVSYIKYSDVGRIVEMGETVFTNESVLLANADNSTFPSTNTAEVYQCEYDTPSGVTYEPEIPGRGWMQRNLRNRVSTIRRADGESATHISYDPHGSIEWIVQDIRGLGKNYLRYEYDRVSGNTRALYYNEGLGDQLLQRAVYDADDRVSRIESSRDGAIWDRDASYFYWPTGTLRRVEYGEDSLQGVDYTYTLHGWVKGINHPSLDPTVDPGRDGDPAGNIHAKYAVDAFGSALTYFAGDFLRKTSAGANSPFNSTSIAGQYTKRPDNLALLDQQTTPQPLNLYNGQPAGWAGHLMAGPAGGPPRAYEQLTGETYEYDRLGRIRTSTFHAFNGTWAAPGDYDSWYTYDPNGNIQTLGRRGFLAGGYPNLDNLTYAYGPGTNKLLNVTDGVLNSLPIVDYENRATVPGLPPGPNFKYDGAGRLIADKNERIISTIWSPYDKVREVKKLAGAGLLHFAYDAHQQRIKKLEKSGSSAITTYYVRDGESKVIAIYTRNCINSVDLAGPQGPGGCVDPNGPQDSDHDGVPDISDNAPNTFNPDQRDTDGDGVADVLEFDRDNDGQPDFPPPNYPDPCPFDPTNQCDRADKDGDGIDNAHDPCPDVPGTGGADLDGDGIPDGCDTDVDGDGKPNNEDNCPWVANPDQADLNGNGIGDVCECSGASGGGEGNCPATLAEQYVYGNGTDGRIATVYPNRPRDMVDHTADAIFTRDLADKEYELNDHLGDVRARFSDVKISQGTPGTVPFNVDLRGYANYYPFGMVQPGREFNLTGGRYGFNGKEMDNTWNNGLQLNGGIGNSYDYGFRTFDPRLGRFLSVDPLAVDYPWLTPYQFADNNPIANVDLDGLETLEVVEPDVTDPDRPVRAPWDLEPVPESPANQIDFDHQTPEQKRYKILELKRSLKDPEPPKISPQVQKKTEELQKKGYPQGYASFVANGSPSMPKPSQSFLGSPKPATQVIEYMARHTSTLIRDELGHLEQECGTLRHMFVLPYKALAGKLPPGLQANHLNQDAAFRDVIPKGEGVAIPVQGASSDIGSEHWRFHFSLDQFWRPYFKGQPKAGQRPTCAEYDVHLREALRFMGLDECDVTAIADKARAQRYGAKLEDNDLVPRVPGGPSHANPDKPKAKKSKRK